MEKIKFRMQNLIRNMVYNRKLTIVVLLTVVISMFFSFMTISNLMHQFKRNELYGKFKPGDLCVSYVSKHVEPDDFLKKMNYLFDYDFNYFCISILSPVVINDETVANTVAGVDKGIILDEPVIIWDGRNFTEDELTNGEDVCIVRSNVKVKVGEYIYFKGKKLKVVGKYTSRNVFANVSLPLKTFSTISSGAELQYYIYFSGVKENADEIVNKIRKNIEGVTADRIMTVDYEEFVKREKNTKWMDFKYNSLSGVLISFVALITIISIYIGRLLQNKKNIGIKLSQGSTRREIVLDSIIEVLIFSFIAIVINLIVFALGESFLSGFMQVYTKISFYLVSVLASIIISFIIGLIGGLYVTKSSVSEMVGV